jgi:hypothetical protein
MTLPASGQISINQVNVELGVAGTTQRSFNDGLVRTLFAVASGAISMSNGYGKANTLPVTPGSNTFTTAGTTSWTIPNFNTMTVYGFGAGASGGSYSGFGTPASGTSTSFGVYLSATGGRYGGYTTDVGTGGTGSGGTSNYTGADGIGTYGIPANGGAGGAAGGYGTLANAGAGGAGAIYGSPGSGGVGGNYGGAGGGAGALVRVGGGAGGGGVGAFYKVFASSDLPIGTAINVTVGAKGVFSATQSTTGANGADGAIFVSWS